MTENDAPFLRRAEVSKLHPVTDRTRIKAEKAGLFPKRVQLAENVSGWRRSEVDEWLGDPAGWVARQQQTGAQG